MDIVSKFELIKVTNKSSTRACYSNDVILFFFAEKERLGHLHLKSKITINV